MFITRQDILSAAPDVVVCETTDYYYMIKEVTEGFSIHREMWNPSRAVADGCKKAVWVGDSPPPESQYYRWVYSWVGGGD